MKNRRRITLLAGLLGVALLLSACATQQPVQSTAPTAEARTEASAATQATPATEPPKAGGYRSISAAQAKERMESGEQILIVDVRTQAEYDSGHIRNALLIPNETIGTERPALLPDLDAEILVYCRSGNRSRQAALKLLALGYTNVHDFGGVNGWPYDLVTD